jgi:hypothetical protein
MEVDLQKRMLGCSRWTCLRILQKELTFYLQKFSALRSQYAILGGPGVNQGGCRCYYTYESYLRVLHPGKIARCQHLNFKDLKLNWIISLRSFQFELVLLVRVERQFRILLQRTYVLLAKILQPPLTRAANIYFN